MSTTRSPPSDSGDFEVTVSSHPKNLEYIRSPRPMQDSVSVMNVDQRSEYSTEVSSELMNSAPQTRLVPKKVSMLVQKMNDLKSLVQCLKQNESSTPIDVLIHNELLAISVLKNQIQNTKQQINASQSDSESSCVVESRTEEKLRPSRDIISKAGHKKITFWESHLKLQEEAMSLLVKKLEKAKELLLREKKANEKLKNENHLLEDGMTRLKMLEENPKVESMFSEKVKTEFEQYKLTDRPYRTIKELKSQLEKKEKDLLMWKSKLSRAEAVNANKGILLENEKRKNGKLENEIQAVKNQLQKSSKQISVLKEQNNQLKKQMEMAQFQKAEKATATVSETKKSELGEHFIELAEILKNEDLKLKSIKEEAEVKLKETENAYRKEIENTRLLLMKAEKKNSEYLKSVKELLSTIHEEFLHKENKTSRKESHDKACHILNISKSELHVLFSARTKKSGKDELSNRYGELLSLVEDEGPEFSSRLSAWLFQIIKTRMLKPIRDDEKN